MEMNTCQVEPIRKIASADECKSLAVIGLAVWGMGCPNCANRVRNSLVALAGVVEADVSHITGFAFVEYNPDLVAKPDLLQAVAQAGDGNHHKYVAMLFDEVS